MNGLRKTSHYVLFVAMLLTLFCQVVHSAVCACQMQIAPSYVTGSSANTNSIVSCACSSHGEIVPVHTDCTDDHRDGGNPNHDFGQYIANLSIQSEESFALPIQWQVISHDFFIPCLCYLCYCVVNDASTMQEWREHELLTRDTFVSLGYLRPSLN